MILKSFSHELKNPLNAILNGLLVSKVTVQELLKTRPDLVEALWEPLVTAESCG